MSSMKHKPDDYDYLMRRYKLLEQDYKFLYHDFVRILTSVEFWFKAYHKVVGQFCTFREALYTKHNIKPEDVIPDDVAPAKIIWDNDDNNNNNNNNVTRRRSM